jgi:urease accessory protein
MNNEQLTTLKLKLQCDSEGKTIIKDRYETHPLRVSRPFRFDQDYVTEEEQLSQSSDRRAYIYLRNNSPGLLAQDKLNLDFDLAKNTQLYITEQSATKVHPMKANVIAEVNYQWKIGEQAIVEFVPEPLILYQDSALIQTTIIKIHPTASLFWCDLILPGRLARGEFYQFRYYDHALEVYSDTGELWFKERVHLMGCNNPFSDHPLFASFPVLGNAIAIMPQIEVNLLKSTLDSLSNNYQYQEEFLAATSVLPHNKGVLIRVLAAQTQKIKSYWHSIVTTLRQLNHQPLLPVIPK